MCIDTDGTVDCVESGLENIFFCQQSTDFNPLAPELFFFFNFSTSCI